MTPTYLQEGQRRPRPRSQRREVVERYGSATCRDCGWARPDSTWSIAEAEKHCQRANHSIDAEFHARYLYIGDVA
jgi:hypothetical protein